MSAFVESVLGLRPRIAVFDCDGTLWPLDSGAEFFYWEIEQRLLPEEVARRAVPRYADYDAGNVSEEDICGEMVAWHAGLSEAEMIKAGERFFRRFVQPLTFPEMLELSLGLRESGCELWAVSSTNEWVVRAGARHFGIPDEHVLAACVHMEHGRVTDRLLRVPTGEAKAEAVRKCIGGAVDCAFGNSMHDAAMLALARHAFAVNPTPELEEVARQRGWVVYTPTRATAA